MATRWRILLSIALFVLVLDQVTKFWAVAELTRVFEMQKAQTFGEQLSAFLSEEKLERLRSRPVVVLQEHLRFKYVENPGAAWGMFGGLPDGLRVPFFFGVSVLAIGFLLAFFRRLPGDQRLLQVALALVLGGALGNFVDRILRGYVIDFIDLHWQNDPRLHWPTFNVADIGISVGVALLLSHTLFGRHPLPAPAEVAGEPPAPHPENPRYIELPEPETPAVEPALLEDRQPSQPMAVNAEGAIVDGECRPHHGDRSPEDHPGNRADAGGGSDRADPTPKE